MLVTADWLVAHHADPRVRVLDPREGAEYDAGHVPGAANAHTPFKDPERPLHVMPPDHAAATISALGISEHDTVIITSIGMLGGRAWWFLRYHGHPDVRILDGGFEAYRDAGGPVSAERSPVAPAHFVARVDPTFIVRAQELRAELGSPTKIVDVRSDAEWRGSNTMGHTRVGHIPGARHLLWESVLEPDPPHRFRSPAEIRALAAERGVMPADRVVTVCEVGWRAAHTAFALRLAGFTDVRVYDASMREWDNDTALPLEPPAV